MNNIFQILLDIWNISLLTAYLNVCYILKLLRFDHSWDVKQTHFVKTFLEQSIQRAIFKTAFEITSQEKKVLKRKKNCVSKVLQLTPWHFCMYNMFKYILPFNHTTFPLYQMKCGWYFTRYFGVKMGFPLKRAVKIISWKNLIFWSELMAYFI